MIEQLDCGVWVVKGDSHYGHWAKIAGSLDVDTHMRDVLQKIIRDHKIHCAIQVGANIGQLTKAMNEAGCFVYAFDANPDAIKCAHKNCDPERTDFYALGVGDAPGRATLHLQENVGASYLTMGGTVNDAAVVSLDSVEWNLHVPPKLMLLDCEGWEPKVLRGAKRIINKHRPIIVLEVNQGALYRAQESHDGLSDVLTELGYPKEKRTILQPQCDWMSEQYDILCHPTESK